MAGAKGISIKTTALLGSFLLAFLQLSAVNIAEKKPADKSAISGWLADGYSDDIALYRPSQNRADRVQSKAIAYSSASVAELLATLIDVDNHHKWQGYGVYTYVINEITSREKYLHTLVKAPWPMEDREILSKASIVKKSANKFYVRIKDVKTDYDPFAHKELVRVPYSLIEWCLTREASGRVRIELTISADPGGEIPMWLYRLATKSMPIETIKGLRRYAEEGQANPSLVKEYQF